MQDNTKKYIQKFKRGDKKAFDDIVNLHKDWAINLILSMVHNKQDAEDISQDVFVSVYFALNDFKGTSKFKTWIYRIIINKVNAFYNKLKIKSFFSFELSNIEELNFYTDKSLFDQFDRELLHKAIVKLNVRQRNIVLLRIYQGHTFKEISNFLKISENAAKVTFHQAKNKLKDKLIK